MSELDASRVVGSMMVKAYGVLGALTGSPREDAWRMAARVHLRGEVAKFTLATLGLRGDAAPTAFLKRFSLFLREQPVAAQALEWHRHSAVRVPKETIDLTWARFDASGRLQSVEPLLDDREAVPYERFLRGLLSDLVVEAYNETRFLPDEVRALATSDYAVSRIGAAVSRAALPQDAREAARTWVWRVLTSVMVTFERIEGASDPRRFVIPQFLDARHFGPGVFNARVRQVDGDTLDLWVQVNHAAVDGRPVEIMLDALRTAWGHTPVEFPLEPAAAPETPVDGAVRLGTVVVDAVVPPVPPLAPGGFEGPAAAARPAWTHPSRCSTAADPPHLYTALEFVDLAPFLEVRRELGNVSPTAMLLWMLAHQPAFADRRFAVAADVPPLAGAPPDSRQGRQTVCFIVLRPADWFPGAFSGAGFEAFVTAFEREAALTRRRESETWRLLEQTAPMPAVQQALSARFLPRFGRESIGTVGVSVLRGADIFVAPYHPVFVDGFIALGDFAHAASGGATRCAVTFKGSRRRLEACRDALLAVAASPRRYFPLG